jgi:hypothetical protein
LAVRLEYALGRAVDRLPRVTVIRPPCSRPRPLACLLRVEPVIAVGVVGVRVAAFGPAYAGAAVLAGPLSGTLPYGILEGQRIPAGLAPAGAAVRAMEWRRYATDGRTAWRNTTATTSGCANVGLRQ